MVRLASVNAPQFPLQLLFRRHPQWRELPTAVVSEDKPLGRIVSVNRKAQQLGIEPKMRFAAALSLCSTLQAAVVPSEVIHAGVEDIIEILRSFTPEVEPCAFEAGLFWVNASGLEALYGSVDAWAHRLIEALEQAEFFAAVTVGFSRFGTYACSKRRPQIKVFETDRQEADCARSSPIGILPFPPLVHQRLEHLGIKTVGAFAQLSRGSVAKRFGKEIAAIHDFVTGEKALPLQPLAVSEPHRMSCSLQTPEIDIRRLTLRIEELVSSIASSLSQSTLIFSIGLELGTEDGEEIETSIRPAKPTRSLALVMKLVTLRIQNTALPGAVERITVELETVHRERSQEELFSELVPRDSRSADAAFALIRAELGNDSIVRSTLCAEHLPEQQFTLEPMYSMPNTAAMKPKNRRQVLARRILTHPSPTKRSFHRADIAIGRARSSTQSPRGSNPSKRQPAASRSGGPFVVTGAWWHAQVDREYYFVATRSRRLLWVYFDRLSDRWIIQGWID